MGFRESSQAGLGLRDQPGFAAQRLGDRRLQSAPMPSASAWNGDAPPPSPGRDPITTAPRKPSHGRGSTGWAVDVGDGMETFGLQLGLVVVIDVADPTVERLSTSSDRVILPVQAEAYP